MLFENSDDATCVGEIHGLLGSSEEELPADSPESQYWSYYQQGHRAGSSRRQEMLAQGKSDEWIADYAEAYLLGWTDAIIEKMGGKPSSFRQSRRQASLRH